MRAKEQTERASENSRAGSDTENGSSDGRIAEETASSRQGNSSDEVGSAHEQPEGTSRRNHSQGDNLQLDLGLGGEEQEDTLPPFDLQDLPALLREM